MRFKGFVEEFKKYSKDSTEIHLNPKLIIISNSKPYNILDLKVYTKLVKLNCSHYGITSIINVPETLIELQCSNNRIVEFPTGLPCNLKILICSHNKINKLPVLPNNLRELYYSYNDITEIPILPNNLEILYCNYNKNQNMDMLFNNLPKSLKVLSYNKTGLINLALLLSLKNLIILSCPLCYIKIF